MLSSMWEMQILHRQAAKTGSMKQLLLLSENLYITAEAFIGVGEPAAHQWQGKFFQLDDILGVEEEHGFNLNTDKYNWDEHRDHFILADSEGKVNFGEGKKNIFALPETKILIQNNQEVQMAVKTFGKGRGVYISGLPYSFKNSRILYRAVLWSASAEEELHCWYLH